MCLIMLTGCGNTVEKVSDTSQVNDTTNVASDEVIKVDTQEDINGKIIPEMVQIGEDALNETEASKAFIQPFLSEVIGKKEVEALSYRYYMDEVESGLENAGDEYGFQLYDYEPLSKEALLALEETFLPYMDFEGVNLLQVPSAFDTNDYYKCLESDELGGDHYAYIMESSIQAYETDYEAHYTYFTYSPNGEITSAYDIAQLSIINDGEGLFNLVDGYYGDYLYTEQIGRHLEGDVHEFEGYGINYKHNDQYLLSCYFDSSSYDREVEIVSFVKMRQTPETARNNAMINAFTKEIWGFEAESIKSRVDLESLSLEGEKMFLFSYSHLIEGVSLDYEMTYRSDEQVETFSYEISDIEGLGTYLKDLFFRDQEVYFEYSENWPEGDGTYYFMNEGQWYAVDIDEYDFTYMRYK